MYVCIYCTSTIQRALWVMTGMGKGEGKRVFFLSDPTLFLFFLGIASNPLVLYKYIPSKKVVN